MNKRYWFRGLVAGIIFYVFFLVFTYLLLIMLSHGQAMNALANGISVIAIYISPIIPLSLLIGWIYGKMPIIAILLSIIIIVFMAGLEVVIIKNTIYAKPYTPQPSIVPGSY